MNIYDAIEARRTIHKYEPNVPMDAALLNRALEAALLAPNHKFTFPWKFIQVGDQTRKAMAELSCKIQEDSSGSQLSAEGREKVFSKFLDPSALVVFCRAQSDDDFRAREDYATIACSIENFCLVLAAGGWGTKWSTGSITRDPQMYGLLHVDEQAYQIEGFLWVGKPSKEPGPQKRPELSEVLKVLP